MCLCPSWEWSVGTGQFHELENTKSWSVTFPQKLFIYLFIFILWALVFCLYVYLCEDVKSLGAGSQLWAAMNHGSLEEQPVLLAAEQPLQPPKAFFFFKKQTNKQTN